MPGLVVASLFHLWRPGISGRIRIDFWSRGKRQGVLLHTDATVDFAHRDAVPYVAHCLRGQLQPARDDAKWFEAGTFSRCRCADLLLLLAAFRLALLSVPLLRRQAFVFAARHDESLHCD
jgi:hypothetical protein